MTAPTGEFVARIHSDGTREHVEVLHAPDRTRIASDLLAILRDKPRRDGVTLTDTPDGQVLTAGTPSLGLGVVRYRIGPPTLDGQHHEATREDT